MLVRHIVGHDDTPLERFDDGEDRWGRPTGIVVPGVTDRAGRGGAEPPLQHLGFLVNSETGHMKTISLLYFTFNTTEEFAVK
jgi:hypothetical protein